MPAAPPGQLTFWPPYGRRRRDLAKQPGQPGVLMAWVRQSHPMLGPALRADVAAARRFRGEPERTVGSRWDLLRAVVRESARSDGFAALACYRAKAAAQRRGIPAVPHVLHKVAILVGQVCIGDPVHVDAGIHVPHGQIVADGFTTVRSGVVLHPFTTLGLKIGSPDGPTIADGATIEAGAKVLGAVTVGARAVVGVNSVVVDHVFPGAHVTGVPARPDT